MTLSMKRGSLISSVATRSWPAKLSSVSAAIGVCQRENQQARKTSRPRDVNRRALAGALMIHLIQFALAPNCRADGFYRDLNDHALFARHALMKFRPAFVFAVGLA